MSQNYSEMPYGEVQKLAKERGLEAKGTKEELIARLVEADGGEEPLEETEPEPEAAQNAPEPKKKAISEKEVETMLRTDKQKMKAHLDAQPKVSVMIPLEAGVSAEVAQKIPFVCNLNGYRYEIKRGVFVEVPLQIAEMVKERLESEGKIGQEFRLDRDPAKQTALG